MLVFFVPCDGRTCGVGEDGLCPLFMVTCLLAGGEDGRFCVDEGGLRCAGDDSCFFVGESGLFFAVEGGPYTRVEEGVRAFFGEDGRFVFLVVGAGDVSLPMGPAAVDGWIRFDEVDLSLIEPSVPCLGVVVDLFPLF